jgi:hypothetical protein
MGSTYDTVTDLPTNGGSTASPYDTVTDLTTDYESPDSIVVFGEPAAKAGKAGKKGHGGKSKANKSKGLNAQTAAPAIIPPSFADHFQGLSGKTGTVISLDDDLYVAPPSNSASAAESTYAAPDRAGYEAVPNLGWAAGDVQRSSSSGSSQYGFADQDATGQAVYAAPPPSAAQGGGKAVKGGGKARMSADATPEYAAPVENAYAVVPSQRRQSVSDEYSLPDVSKATFMA